MGTAGCEQQQYRNIEPESEKENIINTDVSDETVIDFSDREETVDSKSEDQGDMMSEIEYQYRFSEDRAWIKMLESSSYQGDFICVDSGGHVLFSVDSTEVEGILMKEILPDGPGSLKLKAVRCRQGVHTD